jgi:hypothetical protein
MNAKTSQITSKKFVVGKSLRQILTGKSADLLCANNRTHDKDLP